MRAVALLAALALAGCLGPAAPQAPAAEVRLAADLAQAAGAAREQQGGSWRVEADLPVTYTVGSGSLRLADVRLDGGPGLTLRVAAGGRVELERVQAAGLRVVADGGTVVVQGATWTSSPAEWMVVAGADVTVVGSELRASADGSAGIRATDSTLRIEGSRLADAGGYAVELHGGALRMANSTVASGHDYGLQATDAAVALSGNRWEAFCGAFVRGGRLDLDGDTFTSPHRGLTVNGDAGVRSARFEGVQDGLTIHGGTVAVSGSRFSGSEVAASVRGGNVTFAGNTFSGNQGALEARGWATLAVRGNGFSGNSGFAVHNLAPVQLDAAGNWWGSADGPRTGPSGDIVGDVGTSPWLAAWNEGSPAAPG